MISVKRLLEPKYWLLATAPLLISLHLIALWKVNEPDLQSMSIFLWIAIIALMWDKYPTIAWHSGLFSTIFGSLLIALVLLRTNSSAGYHLLLFPFISGVGWCLLASGIKGLHNYWKELIILGLLVIYPIITFLLRFIELPTMTAEFSTLILKTIGQTVTRQGDYIILPTGKVEVYSRCSGIESIIQMFNIAVLFILVFTPKKIQRLPVIIISIFLGFMINALRVSLLAILVASDQMDAFHYWHDSEANIIFSIVSVALFTLICWFFFLRSNTLNLES